MRRHVVRVNPAILATMLVAGCATLRGGPANAPVDGEWSATLAQARQEALDTRFGVADHLLSDFATRHAGTMEALDAGYYRALFKLDPANATGTVRDAEALLDAYLAVAGPLPMRADATTLRHIATALERSSTVATSSPTATGSSAPSTAADKTRDEELQRLRDELAKANAELERIKRRLAQPKP